MPISKEEIRRIVEQVVSQSAPSQPSQHFPPHQETSPSSPPADNETLAAAPPAPPFIQQASNPRPTPRSGAIPSTARAAVLTRPGTIEIREFPIPDISDDEILIRVEGCGVCGTDVHEYKKDPFGLCPVVLGHEGTGEIVRLGKNVKVDFLNKPVRVGDRIVTSLFDTSPECITAKDDPSKANLCDDLAVYGLLPDDPHYHLNGYFAEYMVVRKGSNFFQVNDLNLYLRLLLEPAAVVVHALERAKSTGILNFRSRVLIQGCGPIGLLMLAAARVAGTENIIAVDGDESRLKMARLLGANTTINYKDFHNTDELIGAVKAATSGKGAHFVFQCTGVPAAASNAWKFVRRGGGLCEIGFFVDNGECSINPHWDLCRKEISVVGSWVYTLQDYPIAANFLRRAQGIGLPIERLITHRFSLDEMDRAMQVNIAQEGLKVAYINE